MINDDDDFKITIEDAQEIARRVVSADGKERPLIGKEQDLLEELEFAKWQHDEAFVLYELRREEECQRIRLRKALDKALQALDEYPGDLALLYPDLDESLSNPNSERDLRGLLRRAIDVLDFRQPLVFDRRDLNSKFPRRIRSHPDKVSSVGLRKVVETLDEFWYLKTGLQFSDDFEKSLDERGEDGPLKPKGLAAILVYETARLIDPRYTAEACSNAMRQR